MRLGKVHTSRQMPVFGELALNSSGCMELSKESGQEEARLIRTSTSKDYALARSTVNFAVGGSAGSPHFAIRSRRRNGPGRNKEPCPKSFSSKWLEESNQAAWGAGSSSEPLMGVKYLSKVLIAASKTMWQSEQESKCRLISIATGGESLPSKYQHIKWIVSRQLMTAVPPWPRAYVRPSLVLLHLIHQIP